MEKQLCMLKYLDEQDKILVIDEIVKKYCVDKKLKKFYLLQQIDDINPLIIFKLEKKIPLELFYSEKNKLLIKLIKNTENYDFKNIIDNILEYPDSAEFILNITDKNENNLLMYAIANNYFEDVINLSLKFKNYINLDQINIFGETFFSLLINKKPSKSFEIGIFLNSFIDEIDINQFIIDLICIYEKKILPYYDYLNIEEIFYKTIEKNNTVLTFKLIDIFYDKFQTDLNFIIYNKKTAYECSILETACYLNNTEMSLKLIEVFNEKLIPEHVNSFGETALL